MASNVELDSDYDIHEDAPFLSAEERSLGNDDVDSSIPPFRRNHVPTAWSSPSLHPRCRRPFQIRSPTAVIALCAVIKGLVVLSGMLLMIPIYRLIEDALCHVYWEDDSAELLDEMRCKGDEVQSRLAALMGWVALLNSVISFIVAYPYGMLADKIGRKPVLILSFGSIVASLMFTPFSLGVLGQVIRENTSWLFLGSFFQIFGGGIPVLLATLYAVAADVSSEKDKASSFLYLTLGATVGGLSGPLIAGLLMEAFGPWVPIYVVLVVTPFVFCLFLLLPETLKVDVKVRQLEQLPLREAAGKAVSNGLKDVRESVRMLRNPSISLILVTFLFQNVRGNAYTSMLAQYISKHFGWRLAETSILLSPVGLLNLLILGGVPQVSKLLTSPRFGFSTFRKDLFLTRTVTVMLVIATAVQGLSRTIGFFIFGLALATFGSADSALARATVSHYVGPDFTSRLYALIGMVDVVGSFLSGPVIAWLFKKGLEWRGVWTGLPWFYVSTLCGISLVALYFVRPPTKGRGVGGVQEEAAGEAIINNGGDDIESQDDGLHRD